jgi:hypothetical protein
MDDNARASPTREVPIDDWIWEWAREQSGLDDPTPFIMDILNKAMKEESKLL